MTSAKLQGFDVLMLDTAGRLHVDQVMDEMKAVADIATPNEILLVVDSLTGQDAVNVAQNFSDQVPLTGVIEPAWTATRAEALRCRCARSPASRSSSPAWAKLDAIEPVPPWPRVASRILGMGDVVSLVEKAAQSIQAEDAERMAARLEKGKFDMNDLRAQLGKMRNMGLGALAGMIPGMKKAQQSHGVAVDEKILLRMDAMIGSMTLKERAKPELISAKRKIRVAKGSGTTVQDINKLLKMHQEMATAMKRIKKMGGLKGMMSLLGKGGMGGLGNALGGQQMGDMMGKMDAPGALPSLGGPGGMQLPRLRT